MRKNIIRLDSVGSTNDYALELLKSGDKTTFAVISESQSDGHGRLGRSFHSPDGVGIYMTLIIQSDKIKNLKLLTSYAGLAVAKSIDKIYATECKIKWPNDIIISGRKICGILAKLATDKATQKITHVLIGIGINVNNTENDFPEELKKTASSLRIETGALSDKKVLENEIIFQIKNILSLSQKELINEIKIRSSVIGKNVFVRSENKTLFVEDISDEGELIVTDGEKRTVVFTGEVELV